MNEKRNIKNGPFCWQEKQVLRFIRDCFDDTNSVASALSVYLSLTEKASDAQSDQFDCRIRDIASRAGVSYRTAGNVLRRFAVLGLIAIQRNKIKNTQENAPSTYTLLRLGNDCPRLGNGRKQPSLPRKIEESSEQTPEKSSRTLSNNWRDTHHSDEWRSNYLVEELEIIDLYNQICVPLGWRSVNAYSDELQKALEIFSDSTLEDFQTMFENAADERDRGDKTYNTPLGNKLIRILWGNY
jgi:hypothetical protein